MSTDCIFCKIARGEIPATKVVEDDRVLAFMDINPISQGHLLIIPKTHYELIMDMPADLVSHIYSQVPELARALVDVTEAQGVNVLQNNGPCSGQVIPHVHIHLIPRWPADGLGFRWPAKSADLDELQKLAQAISSAL